MAGHWTKQGDITSLRVNLSYSPGLDFPEPISWLRVCQVTGASEIVASFSPRGIERLADLKDGALRFGGTAAPAMSGPA
jgi:hypothetical protein